MQWGWLKSVGSGAKKVGVSAGKLGIEYAEARYPFLAPLVDLISKKVSEAQASGKSGPEKKEIVLGQIDVSGEQILEWIEKAGMVVADRDLFFQATGQLVDAVKAIQKATAPATGFSGSVPPGSGLQVQEGRIVGFHPPTES